MPYPDFFVKNILLLGFPRDVENPDLFFLTELLKKKWPSKLSIIFKGRQTIFLNFYLLGQMPQHEAVLLKYDRKLEIFKMQPSRLLIYMMSVSFVQNLVYLPFLAQYLHESAC